MARLSRVCPIGVPQHIIQRGNNRQVCFAGEQDFAAYVVSERKSYKPRQAWDSAIY